jgi:hypothetical protein
VAFVAGAAAPSLRVTAVRFAEEGFRRVRVGLYADENRETVRQIQCERRYDLPARSSKLTAQDPRAR